MDVKKKERKSSTVATKLGSRVEERLRFNMAAATQFKEYTLKNKMTIVCILIGGIAPEVGVLLHNPGPYAG